MFSIGIPVLSLYVTWRAASVPFLTRKINY